MIRLPRICLACTSCLALVIFSLNPNAGLLGIMRGQSPSFGKTTSWNKVRGADHMHVRQLESPRNSPGDAQNIGMHAVPHIEERFLGDEVPHTGQGYFACLAMSLLAGLSTTLGAGIIAFLPGNYVPPSQMAFILAFAGGVMLSTSALEFWVPAILEGGQREFGRIVGFSGIGVLAFLLFSYFVPEPEMVSDKAAEKTSPRPMFDVEAQEGELSQFVPAEDDGGEHCEDGVVIGKATSPNAEVASGGGGVHGDPTAEAAGRRMRLAMVMMLSLTAHNFPEGMAVAISALDDQRLGFIVMFAIAVHNIPEGIAISVPVLSATGSRWKALNMTLLSGMAEPLGAAVALLLTHTAGAPSEHAMNNLLCVVGGVMSAVSLKELMPESLHLRRPAASAAGFVAGFLIMLVTHHLGA